MSKHVLNTRLTGASREGIVNGSDRILRRRRMAHLRLERGPPARRRTDTVTASKHGVAAVPSSGWEHRSLDSDDDLAYAEARERVHAIYREHSTTLLNHLTRATGCRDVARELLQETFVRLLRMPPATLRGIEIPEAYLRRIAINLLRDRARSRSLSERSRPALEISAEGLLDQVAVLESRDTLRRLERAIDGLKPKTREIFLAHRIHGLSYAQIAASTGLSVKGVEKHMSKAIAKIDRFLNRI